MLTIALPKGRLAEESIDFLIQRKLLSTQPPKDSKELFYIDPVFGHRIVMVRSQDVGTYVEEGACDWGVIGWDVYLENHFDLLALVDLPLGKCRLSLAGLPDFDLSHHPSKVRVATKYPFLAKQFFFQKGIACEVIKLYGSIELAPILGLSDCIVDLVSTGGTLKANGLVEKEIILQSQAYVVWNRRSFYHRNLEADKILDAIAGTKKMT
jgi:ATP phosphoribosyltransferase